MLSAEDVSDGLQKAKLDLIDILICIIKYNSSLVIPHGVTRSMICASDRHGNWNEKSCQGESGGPLQIIHPNNSCIYQVMGITSFGQGCEIDTPEIYTRVSHYLQWIEENVWPQR